MKKELTKNDVIQSLKSSLESHPDILAAFLGGSTATGYEDDLSDTDIVAICQNPALAFEEIEKALKPFGSFSHVWRVEESPWKNFSQKFYVFSEGPETYFVDAGVFSSVDPNEYREWFNFERHGKPVILFDKTNILAEAAKSPRLENPKKMDWPQWLGRFEILYRTFVKEALRGKLIDSFTFYQRLLTMWVQLQRLQKTPQKQDFGFRYIYRDLSKDDSALIEKYIQASDIESMQAQALDMRHRLYELYKNSKTESL